MAFRSRQSFWIAALVVVIVALAVVGWLFYVSVGAD
jgi:uncharacterized membrane protein